MTKQHPVRSRLWRVNIDGKIVEGRWRTAFGAINGAISKIYPAPNHVCHNNEHLPDLTDMAIHVQCIGDPVPHPEEKPLRGEAMRTSALADALAVLGGGLSPEETCDEASSR